MSTSWFGIDQDGKVAVFNFEDNGPVPQFVPSESSMEELLTEVFPNKSEDGGYYLNFNDNQCTKIEKDLVPTKTENLSFDMVVRINPTMTNEFIKTCLSQFNRHDYSYPYVCISKSRGLYIVDFYNWGKSAINRLVKNEVILQANMFDCLIWGNLSEGEDEHRVRPESYPVYIFEQPYDTNNLIECTSVPEYPLTENQLSSVARSRALRLPISFDKGSKIQIAEHYPSGVYCETESIYDGNREVGYLKLPLGKGQSGKIRNCLIGELNCSVCGKCKIPINEMFLYVRENSWHPTVLLLTAPVDYVWETWEKTIEYRIKSLPFLDKMTIMPILPSIGLEKERYKYSNEELNQLILSEDFSSRIENCAHNLKEGIITLNPHVVLLTTAAEELIKQTGIIEKDNLMVNGNIYPYFIFESTQDNLHNIQTLADKPYRGKRIKRIEVDNKENEASVN